MTEVREGAIAVEVAIALEITVALVLATDIEIAINGKANHSMQCNVALPTGSCNATVGRFVALVIGGRRFIGSGLLTNITLVSWL